ncbi:MAG: hypothetical protein KDB53_17760 [Planctomycetes bacterium]|nr:hypothetical protein [Planctomycetota bacterium]
MASEADGSPRTGFIESDGRWFDRIDDVQLLDPFLMSLPSTDDSWIFVASNGAVTMGRGSPGNALFPYETVDRLYEARHSTGPITLIRLNTPDHAPILWEPFAASNDDDPRVRRRLEKSATGDLVRFTETREDLQLAFSYSWQCVRGHGFVRRARLANPGDQGRRLEVMDGLRNLQPYGVPLEIMQRTSSLVDAYRRTDIDRESNLAVLSLTTRIIDRPEAQEALRANVVWMHGLDDATIVLSDRQIRRFRRGEALEPEAELLGQRASFLCRADLDLAPGEDRSWIVAADVGYCHRQLADLRDTLGAPDLAEQLAAAEGSSTKGLVEIVAGADGIQNTADAKASVHHWANTLFNVMRGGTFVAGHEIPLADFARFVEERTGHAPEALPEGDLDVSALIAWSRDSQSSNLQRLALEYLPLHFSRRHGDPSRPWNQFKITARRPGAPLAFEGNWRDIFQNWEALAHSHPGFATGMIARFVNGVTQDGYNPARLDRNGVGWDRPDPEDPWSTIGYWSDHQVVYLLRLLELARRFWPGQLEDLTGRSIFATPEVPYQIRPHADIVADPRNSVDFDHELDQAITARVQTSGADGRLLRDENGQVFHVTLAEKLLTIVMAKLCNLVPGGGIWMNTQRPEWNDANNALAGPGLSVVTTLQLVPFITFVVRLLEDSGQEVLDLTPSVAAWLTKVSRALDAITDDAETSDVGRREALEGLGQARDARRAIARSGSRSATTTVPTDRVLAMLRVGRDLVQRTALGNRRDDGFFHSYNILKLDARGTTAAVSHLDLMLEGQAAAVASGLLGAEETAELIEALFRSSLYRADQKSFLLQPVRQLPKFWKKNAINERRARSVDFAARLLDASEDSIIALDSCEVVRFQGDLKNHADLDAALLRLTAQPGWRTVSDRDRQDIHALFEETFGHAAFLGRSVRMYGYEGIGCIYWHMVAKLGLAVQEASHRAGRSGDPQAHRLGRLYYRIREGLGFEKTSRAFGAFSTDPYSHTPSFAGASQPGMTGQVKEETIARLGELGIRWHDGVLHFEPRLLRRREFFDRPTSALVSAGRSGAGDTDAPARGLCFSHCGVRVVYRLGNAECRMVVRTTDGVEHSLDGLVLSTEWSREVAMRTGEVREIDVTIPETMLFEDG